jgi:hypothetical protein
MLLSKAIFKRKLQLDTIINHYPKKGMGIDSRPAAKFSELLNLYLVGDGINYPSIDGIADTALLLLFLLAI